MRRRHSARRGASSLSKLSRRRNDAARSHEARRHAAGAVIDINALEGTTHGRIESGQNGLRLGALVRMADAAEHLDIQKSIPGHRPIVEARRQPADPQYGEPRRQCAAAHALPLFPRCFVHGLQQTQSRIGCAAITGFNRPHAVLGVSDNCIATYAGDFAQALIALDAAVEIAGSGGTRTIPFATLHRKPGDTPDKETICGRTT